jgi:hypothetical protein
VILIPEYEQFFGVRNGNMGVLKAMSYQQAAEIFAHAGPVGVALLQSLITFRQVKILLEQTFTSNRIRTITSITGGFNPSAIWSPSGPAAGPFAGK